MAKGLNVTAQFETSKTAWWYVALAIGKLGFVKTAIKIVKTKPVIKLGKVKTETIKAY